MNEHNECVAEMPMSARRPKLKKLDCDQVSQLMVIFRRLLEFASSHGYDSKRNKAAKLAALLEIMELLGYEFEDSAAAGNAIAAFWEFNEMRGDLSKNQ